MKYDVSKILFASFWHIHLQTLNDIEKERGNVFFNKAYNSFNSIPLHQFHEISVRYNLQGFLLDKDICQKDIVDYIKSRNLIVYVFTVNQSKVAEKCYS